MQPEISDWIALAALVTSLFAYLEGRKSNRNNVAYDALKEVVDASEKTQTYMQSRAEGNPRSRETEWELAENWSRAALLISRVNKDLSVRLNAKSVFWRNPDTWESDLRAYKDISLESVTADARKLMHLYA